MMQNVLITVPALILFLLPLAYSPGPGNMFFAANGARFGFRKTLAATTGYHLATWIVTLAIGLGFGWMATGFPQVLTALTYAGSAYVLYLAAALIRSGTLDQAAEPRHAGFTDGAILLLLNPKAYLIIALMFTQFTPADSSAPLPLVLLITTVFTLNNLLAFSVWTLAGGRLGALFRHESQARQLNLFFGTVLALVALWMVWR